MVIKFNIHYAPTNGEELYIQISNPNDKELKLNYMENSIWYGRVQTNGLKHPELEYKYFVKRPDGEIFYETGEKRLLNIEDNNKRLEIYDQWCGNTLQAVTLTAPFSRVWFSSLNNNPIWTANNEYIIHTIVPHVPQGYKVYLTGSAPEFGGWDIDSAIEMTSHRGNRWEVGIGAGHPAGIGLSDIEYKFILINKNTGDCIWERGENRKLSAVSPESDTTILKEVSSPDFGLPMPRMAGCVAPVFSLRSKESLGVGDFKDLRLLVDWAHKSGQSIIQLLPINDTTAHLSWKDSYPYNCISTLALHPLYISIEELGRIKDEEIYARYKKEQEYLNSLQFVDYTLAWEAKMRYCRQIYNQDRDTDFKYLKNSSFGRYGEENREWLYPYAAFCTLRDHFKSADFTKWGNIELYKISRTTGRQGRKAYAEFDASLFSQELIDALVNRENIFTDDIYFYIWLQYELDRQMAKTREYAHSKGIALKGDIPIGIARCSVEAWQYPHLFNFSQSAGAPPDFFSCTGQNWGFPTYNWEQMSRDNYAWWRQRLTILSRYFDSYRIDHILGFFRIWEVPTKFTDGRLGHFYPALPFTPQQIREMGVPFDEKYYCNSGKHGSTSNGYIPTPDDLFIEDPYKEGLYHPMISAKDGARYRELPTEEKEAFNRLYDYFFYSRHNEMWYRNAMRKLQSLLGATNMLACGEDLGMLADSVIECMKNLKILSLELMIMPKQFGVGLGNPAAYPYLSVCTTSTHDSETLRMWLGERNGTTIDNAKDALPNDCIEILKQNLAAPSMLAIFPLQDWISIDSQLRNSKPADERINDPSNPDHYWRYRMHITLEELLGATWMNSTIKAIIQESGR